MSLLRRKGALLTKIESVYATDPVPTGAANAVLFSDFDIKPMEMETVDRDNIRPYIGNNEQLPTGLYSKIDFTVEAAGSGAAGTAPAYGPLLRMCGLSETVAAGVDVTYAPVSSGMESGTIYFNLDGVLHKLTGSRGTVSMEFPRNQRPALKFSFTGLFNQVLDAAAPVVTLTNWKTPLAVNRNNTPTLTLHGFAGLVDSLSIDLANKVIFRSLIGGQENVLITDRKPVGRISMEAVTVVTKDWWSSIKNVTTGALQLVHGTVAGNKVQIDAPKVQIVRPSYSDSEGVVMLNSDLVLVPNSGNDEFTLKVF